MKQLFSAVVLFFAVTVQAQIGVGTTSPTSTLDVRGSFSTPLTSFSSSTTAGASDNLLLFTGTSPATLTLPTAVGITGREYWIKNISTNSSTLTIATTSSQTIDGLSSWSLTQTNKTLRIVSNGTNWYAAAESLPGNSSGTPWIHGGNNVSSLQNFGTTSNYALPFITNNTEKMRLTTGGSLGIGTSTFNGTYPERLLVDAGSSGTTDFQNVIVGKGNTNSYAQLNIQNINAGTGASSDVVATADNGSETNYFVDLGINSSVNSSGVMGGSNDAYLYNMGQNFLIGTGTSSKSLIFMTGGTSQSSNERMRIDGSGNVGIGTNSPSYKLHVSGTNPLFLNGVQTGASTDSVLTLINGVVKKIHPSALAASSNAWSITGNASTNPLTNFIGTTDAQALIIKENNTQVGRFNANSIALGNGATVNTATDSYAFGSGASVTFGKSNSYAIGGSSSVTGDYSVAVGNSASATANNAIALGTSATANSDYAVVAGKSASTGFAAASSISIGNTSVANSPNAIAIGNSASTGFTLTNPLAIGVSTVANGNNAVALGNGASVGFVANGTALGAMSSVSGANSTAVGYNTDVTAANALILGDIANTSLAVGVGTESFSSTSREKLLVDAGAGSGFQNVIVGKGNTNSYAQLNIQNLNTGTAASSDVVATASNGDESSNFIDLGINGGGNTSTGVLGGANTAYLYSTGADFAIGNGGNNRNLNFFTTTSSTYTERMRITAAGNVGIANTSPSEKLDVTGNVRFSGALMPNNSAGTAGYFLQSMGANTAPVWFDASNFAWQLNGNGVTSAKTLGTTTNYDLPIITNNNERMRITSSGNVGINTTTFSATNPEQLIVDAGTNALGAYQNVIVGKGNTNNYAQLNIQNGSSGTAASSDVVATANNGSESVNFIDMGINGGSNSSTGILGGANTAYLYSTGNDFTIGNSTNDKSLIFYSTTSSTSTERMEITGAGNVGIGNINPNSTLDVSGTVGHSITTTTTNLTLGATHYTVIITGSTPTITLPAAGSTNARRVYVIVNQTGSARAIGTSTYKDFAGANASTVAANSSITIQSDGTNWYRIH